ncbi:MULTISPECIES: LuxR C-terminal-related transcriptional regulator [Enterobacterales]|uniref:HTH luxR-type domain-containing protein n=1 Tax=Pantoea endophytica TaxID=92488 RepID=A0ABX4SVL6_9GAMM|nr:MULTISPECIES: LuxR C-terminal-related transcriptional regulator [Pantoea]MBB3307683.1 DNA-binding CsgD family transcriptional regulator [Enterobacter sp. Sphag1F]MRT44118.1 hypothetical protein [Enterobacteriaceae bacterium RIT702]NYI16495.1 DNA-binding CsgD family transcriptional regulator [Enterobacter sp. Sphag71]KAJ9430455.1 LuxR C-terminal-related transcriptional regulator [Pantoea sp. YR343]PLR26311.1 hypothetical protein PZBJ_05855 [Pantoea endophytica]
MLSKNGYLLVLGERNIETLGFFSLIDDLSYLHSTHAVYVRDERDFFRRQPCFREDVSFSAIVCISANIFFPGWFNTFLFLQRKTRGRILIYINDERYLCDKKKRLISRIANTECTLYSSMPVNSLRVALVDALNGRIRNDHACHLSLRELSIIDGYIKGMKAPAQSLQLNVNVKTIYQHRKNCANKLGLKSLKDLTRM